jgi:hypothetical protein
MLSDGAVAILFRGAMVGVFLWLTILLLFANDSAYDSVAALSVWRARIKE